MPIRKPAKIGMSSRAFEKVSLPSIAEEDNNGLGMIDSNVIGVDLHGGQSLTGPEQGTDSMDIVNGKRDVESGPKKQSGLKNEVTNLANQKTGGNWATVSGKDL